MSTEVFGSMTTDGRVELPNPVAIGPPGKSQRIAGVTADLGAQRLPEANMTTKMDEDFIFSPLHAIFIFFIIGFLALALLFGFIGFFALNI